LFVGLVEETKKKGWVGGLVDGGETRNVLAGHGRLMITSS
jgi:hypothetical protein